MNLFNKHFFIGFAAGAVFSLIFLFGSSYFFFYVKSPELNEATLKAPPLQGKTKAEYEWSYYNLKGEEIKFSQLKGKVVFLNMWSTWIPPCIAEIASIQKFYDKFRNQGIEFLLISYEKPDRIQNFIGDKGITVPVYTVSKKLNNIFDAYGIPAAFLISRDGTIAYNHIGGARWDNTEWYDFIDQYLQKEKDQNMAPES